MALSNTKPRIGIIGAGRLGTSVARLSLKAGYEVRLANSQGPESLRLILQVLLPGAIATTVGDAITHSDIVVLAVPLHEYKTLQPELFAGKIVIDAMNYWPPTEGDIPEFMDPNISSSEYIQSYLPRAQVVKTLNHVAYNELEEHSQPAGSSSRRAIALAGDDEASKQTVAALLDDFGFDAVDLGPLSAGQQFQPDTTLFNVRYSAAQIRAAIAPGQ